MKLLVLLFAPPQRLPRPLAEAQVSALLDTLRGPRDLALVRLMLDGGLRPGEAQRQGVTVRVARLPLSAVLQTQTTDEQQDFMKALVGGSNDRILGFTMLGPEAGEVVAVAQTALLADLPYPRLRDAVLAHPTMVEGLGQLFSDVPPRPLQ
jgi:Pyridine nucleotide-disulphide oxidoreductase, dimerisation domain